MTLDEFKNGIDWLMSNPDGCVSFKVGKTPEGKDVAIVLGSGNGWRGIIDNVWQGRS